MLIGMIACGQSKSESNEKNEIAKNQSSPPVVTLPSIPRDTLMKLFNTCDYVDYIFYELPFSMSYDNKQSIQSAFSWVSTQPASHNPSCKAIGRLIFQNQGNIMFEAELYFDDVCTLSLIHI